jgi:hypothetical protein
LGKNCKKEGEDTGTLGEKELEGWMKDNQYDWYSATRIESLPEKHK